MASWGKYRLIINNGKTDKILNSTDYLFKILKKTQNIRNITTSHNIFILSKFRPVVKIGYEYQKILPSQTPKFGKKIIFDIPNFGNFIYDAVLYTEIGEIESKKFKLPDLPANKKYMYGGEIIADYWKNPVCYNSYMGEKLTKHVSFSYNTNILDEYYSWSLEIKRKHLDRDKIVGYDNLVNIGRTPKFTLPPTEVWTPIKLWFCEKPEYAFPVVCLPFGQRIIEIELEKLENIASEFDSLEIHEFELSNQPSFAISKTSYFKPQGITGKIIKSELYLNNIFIEPFLLEIYINIVHLTLIRVHQHFEQQGKSHFIIKLKYPVEKIWFLFPYQMKQITNGEDTYDIIIPLIKNIKLNIEGREFQDYPQKLMDTYRNSQGEEGLYLIDFGVSECGDMVKGHINFSRAKRIEMIWNGINENINVRLMAQSLNFIKIHSGTAILQFVN